MSTSGILIMTLNGRYDRITTATALGVNPSRFLPLSTNVVKLLMEVSSIRWESSSFLGTQWMIRSKFSSCCEQKAREILLCLQGRTFRSCSI